MPYHSPINRNRNATPKNRQIIILLGLIISSIVIVIIILFFLVNQLVNFIPVEFEQQLGTIISSQLVDEVKDVPIQRKLDRLLNKLENKLPEDKVIKRDYQIIYSPEKTVNAIAIPGDTIIIYQGLLEKLDSENELAMIIGHEIGHFAHRDHLKRLGNFVLIKLLLFSFVGGGNMVQSGADLTNLIINSQYSQSQEIKADRFGLELLNSYYGHVGGATDFFQKLQQENTINIAFLSSHPLPKKRIKILEKTIKNNQYTIGEKADFNLTINQ